MAEVWLTKTLAGLRPADAESEAIIGKIPMGNTFPADVPVRKSRSLQWHKKYWVLCTTIASNVERIEIEPGGFMEIHTKDDVHTALKYMTGLYDAIVTPNAVIKFVKSTAFDEMTADQFADYYRRVLDVVHQKILPSVSVAALEHEIALAAA
jgi:hypothetical protein